MPKRVDHEQRRGEIADAAWRLIAERGPDAVTLREVSAALGVAHGAPAHYFAGRAAIVECAFRRALDDLDARVARRAAGLSGVAALHMFCEEVIAHTGTPFARVAASGPGPAAVLAEVTARWRTRLAARIEEGRRAGGIVAPAPDGVLVEQLLALLHGVQALGEPGSGGAGTSPGSGGSGATPGPGGAGAAPGEVVAAFLAGLGGGAARAGTAGPGGDPPAAGARSPGREAVARGGADNSMSSVDDSGNGSGNGADGFLAFTDVALARAGDRLPGTDREAMALVLNLHRIAGSLVYDLESTVHRPAGWSWSAFRLLFTLWVAGGQEAGRAAELCGMSRAAVSSLANTLAAGELVRRTPAAGDRRTVHLSLTDAGTDRLVAAFGTHNRRESEWAALLGADDLAALNTLLVRLARAAHRADWINRRT
ncbi:TetR family transcriptional regulator [Pseudonocardia alni]|uniref:TetR family transcriptional regulator n=1 Tax=Pseudonocardia alni TaxID=33907 RepID=A0AA44ZRX6_PSEA5|nr:TetR family transcriptional regulator [Pseudonocardia alni]PKB33456.1 TetR family transcriptional regulator [Pseudonocardia alni]